MLACFDFAQLEHKSRDIFISKLPRHMARPSANQENESSQQSPQQQQNKKKLNKGKARAMQTSQTMDVDESPSEGEARGEDLDESEEEEGVENDRGAGNTQADVSVFKCCESTTRWTEVMIAL